MMIARPMKCWQALSIGLLMLVSCSSPNLSTTIDVKLQESDPQRLIIRNQMSTQVSVVAQQSGQTVDLEPAKSIELSFRVLSIGNFEKTSGEPYYSATAMAPTNHFEEMDNLSMVDTSTPAPEIHYRDPDGREHVISFDLNNCDPNDGWETAHWNSAVHSGQIPSPIAGVPQTLSPVR
jgi:hypothetical protein